ncbi:methyltransferase family protein [Fervidobacterium gondwanense]|uniref:Protein-S-isoprenylcysteine O-methyltransferase Ste14 n=1 Tax=Fervidobacterium gondwanense DSM 13020 TaxID=1121883 RepID=A0A1M7SJS9_FERGO|nr:isoprenylcysteine carboxylmethyltransferase family protein [Fervidobacterium gondwanense]SHN58713.1 Protein-S-isoprenylcysteine O-methyltransferase Ste14 [Fervidobacterium gondwanense DSM 13020]
MRYLFWLSVVAWWIMDFYVLVLRKGSYSKILDKKSKLVVVVLILIGVILAVAPENFRTVWRTREFGAFQIFGTFTVLFGVIIRLLAILNLGEHFSGDIVIGPEKKLVQRGLYKKIRHPSYTGEIISFIGLGLVFQHIPSSIFISVFPFLAFLYRAILEEKNLHREFGDEFIEYKKRTRMFI